MPVPDRNNQPTKTSQSEQYVLNYSFDELFKLLMVGLTAYNSNTDTYDRVEIDNESGGIKTAPSGLSAYDSNSVLRNIAAVESADSPGVYGLLVLNVDGSAVSSGGGGGGGGSPALTYWDSSSTGWNDDTITWNQTT